jgi:uncharacterized protein YuzB (UPF0349 family)
VHGAWRLGPWKDAHSGCFLAKANGTLPAPSATALNSLRPVPTCSSVFMIKFYSLPFCGRCLRTGAASALSNGNIHNEGSPQSLELSIYLHISEYTTILEGEAGAAVFIGKNNQTLIEKADILTQLLHFLARCSAKYLQSSLHQVFLNPYSPRLFPYLWV